MGLNKWQVTLCVSPHYFFLLCSLDWKVLVVQYHLFHEDAEVKLPAACAERISDRVPKTAEGVPESPKGENREFCFKRASENARAHLSVSGSEIIGSIYKYSCKNRAKKK